jgi:hypothetical protein
MFRQALTVRPAGIDVNCYAVFLAGEGREAACDENAGRSKGIGC